MKLITLAKNAKEIVKVPGGPGSGRGYVVYRYEVVGDLSKYYLVWADKTSDIPQRLAPYDVGLYVNIARKTRGATVDIREGEF